MCLHCAQEVDNLKEDKRCKARPWLCSDCLVSPKRIHKWECYASGCMTVEEFAEEQQDMLEDGLGDEEVFYLNDGEDENDEDENDEEE